MAGGRAAATKGSSDANQSMGSEKVVVRGGLRGGCWDMPYPKKKTGGTQ